MSEELNLVTELAIILIAAGTFTVISKVLKQPLILGYIIAGFLVGPNLGLFPQFSSDSVHQWSEIGIIFLLFSLGLEFSFKKLIKIGSSAIITAGTKCIGMFVVGILAGSAMGWTLMESIFLGGLLSMSSTTIIIKAYDDMGLKQKPYASLIFGSLVFEDLIAVLLMVLLSTMAVSNRFAGGEMLMALAKLVFFLILWFLVGIYILPTILKKTRKYITDEILLIVSIGLCFAMVAIANKVGFSSALGAFVMGSLFGETIEGERIDKITSPIKDLFGAIFFVSVGMMVDPGVIVSHWAPIIIITVIAMAGILISSSAGVLLAGKGLDTAIHAGFSLAQLGEFAFIIAGLGCSLGVMREFIYPVVIAVSVITTFTTPYMIKAADPALIWIRTHLPEKFISSIDRPRNSNISKSMAEQNEWKHLLKIYFTRIGLYSVMLIAILLGSKTYLNNLIVKLLENFSPFTQKFSVTAITLTFMSPFLYGLAVTYGTLKAPVQKLIKEKSNSIWHILTLMLLRISLAIIFVLIAILEHFDLGIGSIFLIFIFMFILAFTAKKYMHKLSGIEKRFIANLHEKEELERKMTPVSSSISEKFAGYDVHIEAITISSDYEYIGKKLREMPFRHTTGVNIIKIQRGSSNILIPSGDETIYPGDRLLAVGTSEQLSMFSRTISENIRHSDANETPFTVRAVKLSPSSYLTGKSLREADLRSSGCMVISILRNGVLTTNPKPELIFCNEDIVWLAGIEDSIEWIQGNE